MIGNDIVDLALARKESNWQRKGFLQKIFTAQEQLLICNANNAESMVWELWSRKEAAYKIYNRQSNVRAFNPLKFSCLPAKADNGFLYGTVQYNSIVYYTKTVLTTQYILSVSTLSKEDLQNVYNLFIDNYGSYLNENYIYKNSFGIPFIKDKHSNRLKPISITHHGMFTIITH
jgi:phosphopantetheinyl transferase (holo-ACP synthase)